MKKFSELVPNFFNNPTIKYVKINSKIFNPSKKIKQKLTVHVEAQVKKTKKKKEKPRRDFKKI